MRLNLSNNASTVLQNDINASDTTITVDNTETLPAAPFPLTLNMTEEIVYVTKVSGNTLTVERGQEGTESKAYPSGTECWVNFTIGAYDGLSDGIDEVEEELTSHKADISTEQGRHGIRYWNDKLEVFENNEWVEVGASKLPQEAPSKPVISELKHDSVTIDSDKNSVVSINGTDWFPSPHTFTGLTEETEYTAYAKFEETDVYFESEISSLIFSTKKKGIPLSELPVGTKVKLGKYQVESESPEDLVWQIAAKNHTGYPSNSVTLIAKDIMDLRGFDAKEPSNSDSDRSKYGNNRYKDSNIRQWLNKSGSSWFTKTHTDDEPPTDAGTNNYGTGYDTKEGFLSAFNTDELDGILDTSLKVVKASADGGGSETVTDKVFLLSTTEVGLANEDGTAEGSKLDLFSDNASRKSVLTKQAYDNTKSSNKPSSASDNWFWWLRTPYSGNSSNVRSVRTDGSHYSSHAYFGHRGVRPALNLKSEVYVSDNPDSDGAYQTIF